MKTLLSLVVIVFVVACFVFCCKIKNFFNIGILSRLF